MSNQPNLGEQALDKAAEVAIRSQLDQAEQVDVSVQAQPANIVQGKVDSVTVKGAGVVMKRDLRVEALKLNTDSVSINPLKALTGEIELTEPTNAQAQILLTEVDLNRALASDYLLGKMQGVEVSVQGEAKTLDVQNAKIRLPGERKLGIAADLHVRETGDRIQFTAVAIPSVVEAGQKIHLDIVSAEGKGLSLEFASALFEKIIDLLDLRNFELDGFTLQLQDLIVQKGTLLLETTTTIEKLPKS
ncbi:DUF2993 domain-containing protein [Phormidium tenue FACHB-886]|nr:DUF2993 domain-containing protein [Phormidium tenue FACHB-886]